MVQKQLQEPFYIENEKGQAILKLHRDGKVFAEDREVAVLKSNDELYDLNDQMIYTLNENGKVIDSDGIQIMEILPDGTATNNKGQIFKWSKSGKITIYTDKAYSLNPNNPKSYQAASLLLTLNNNFSENHTIQNLFPMTRFIKSMAKAYVKSGNYGGSTQHEIFPTVYNYSFFDGETSSKNEEFQSILNLYLQHTKVNNSVTLQEYLTHLYNNNTEKLQEIHSLNQDQDKVEMGNSHQTLASLFFVDDEAGTVLKINHYLAKLSWDEHTTNLNKFLQENAKHFSSQIPDEFYTKYYGR